MSLNPYNIYSTLIFFVYVHAYNADTDADRVLRRILRYFFKEKYDIIKRFGSKIGIDIFEQFDGNIGSNTIALLLVMANLMKCQFEDNFYEFLLFDIDMNQFKSDSHFLRVIDSSEYHQTAAEILEKEEVATDEINIADAFFTACVEHYQSMDIQAMLEISKNFSLYDTLAKCLALSDSGKLPQKHFSKKVLAHYHALDHAALQLVFSQIPLIQVVSNFCGYSLSEYDFQDIPVLKDIIGNNVMESSESLQCVKDSAPSDGYHELQNLQRKLAMEKQKAAEFHDIIEEQKKEIERLKKENEALRAYKAERGADAGLKDAELVESSGISNAEVRKALSEEKICVIGGHENWTKKNKLSFQAGVSSARTDTR